MISLDQSLPVKQKDKQVIDYFNVLRTHLWLTLSTRTLQISWPGRLKKKRDQKGKENKPYLSNRNRNNSLRQMIIMQRFKLSWLLKQNLKNNQNRNFQKLQTMQTKISLGKILITNITNLSLLILINSLKIEPLIIPKNK